MKRRPARPRAAVVLNGNAGSVTAGTVRALEDELPEADVFRSKTIDEARGVAGAIVRDGYGLVVPGGGDGTVARILNLLRDHLRIAGPAAGPLPALGLLRLGTGNAWAGASGAGRLRPTLARLREMLLTGAMPTAPYRLLEMEGVGLTHFAGMGWDARILSAYRAQRERTHGEGLFGRGLLAYLLVTARDVIPGELLRMLRDGPPEVELRATGTQALRREPDGSFTPVVPGSVLYRGPAFLVGAGTVTDFGWGLKAFPYARRRLDCFHVRVVRRSPLEFVPRAWSVWNGDYDRDGFADFVVDDVEVRADRPMPFQSAGDPLGETRVMRLGVAEDVVRVVQFG